MEGMVNYSSYSEDKQDKICFKCKNMIHVSSFRIKEKKHGRGKGKYINNICRVCEQKMVEEYRKTDYGIAAEIARRTKSKCKSLNLPYDLDKEWILNKLNSIEWRCELTNIPMNPKGLEGKRGFQWNSISVDRLNHKGGYTKDNIRFVLNQINVFRQSYSDEQMFMLAEALLKNRNKND